MKIRITAVPAKVGYIIVACIVTLLAGIATAFAFSIATGQVVALALGFASLLGAVRFFRGPSEDATVARAWWRLTERPPSGYVMGALFAGQTLAYATSPILTGPLRAVAVILCTVVTAGFLNSSVRLAKLPERVPDRRV